MFQLGIITQFMAVISKNSFILINFLFINVNLEAWYFFSPLAKKNFK